MFNLFNKKLKTKNSLNLNKFKATTKLKTNFGFSLVEIIITISLVLFLSILGIKAFTAVKNREVLNKTSIEIENILKEAQSMSLSAVEGYRYGVHFEISEFTLFRGDVFDINNSFNKNNIINSLVQISNINLEEGGSDLIFNKLKGDTDDFGTITVSLVSDSTKLKIIQILSTGIIR